MKARVQATLKKGLIVGLAWRVLNSTDDGTCHRCHQSMKYGFIRVVKQPGPADNGIDYTKKSEPGDVPK